MVKDRLTGKLAVILHADVVGSTTLVQQDEHLAHERIQQAFKRFSNTIKNYQGHVLELRGDALLAEFERPSDAVTAALAFQTDHSYQISLLKDDLRPTVRVGIAMGEVVIADSTVTGAGVVLAQRVEQLAKPGGVCITSALHEALPKRMPFDLDSLGEQTLKGFDDPVRVYRVELSANQSIPSPQSPLKSDLSSGKLRLMIGTIVIAVVVAGSAAYWFKTQVPKVEAASIDRMAFSLPDKPSVAVLPFTNISNDAEQEYFADGMTDDLITDISKVSGLFVIARNSVFTYKGKAVKVRQVAEELGVRYVMEGSVQRVSNKVRINAQLIDATTGGHVWADRYDGSLDDVFSMRDKITKKIVMALEVTLLDQDQTVSQNETSNVEAYDSFLRGWERYRQGTPEDFAKAVSHFERAIAVDPGYQHAYSALALMYWNISLNGWTKRIGLLPIQVIEQTRLTLKKAMQRPSALAYQVASERSAFLDRKPVKALEYAKQAIALDINDPAGHLAMANALLKAGQPVEAIASVRTAMRLDPRFPASYLTRLGTMQYAQGQYENATISWVEATRRNADDEWAFIYLAAAYGQLNRTEEAAKAIDKANRLRAKSGWGALTIETVSDHRRYGPRRYYFKWFGDYKHLLEGLRKAGLKTETKWRHLISSGTEVKGAKTIDAEAAKVLHERGVIFIDADFKWIQSRIPGTHLLEWWRYHFNEVLLSEIVGKNQEVVIYSSDERWATKAVARAVSWGFEKVYLFPFAKEKWKAAGYPLDTDKK